MYSIGFQSTLSKIRLNGGYNGCNCLIAIWLIRWYCDCKFH